MSVDFFKTPCSEKLRSEKTFGLCDDDDEAVAYSDAVNKASWIARVENNAGEVVFTPIDKCIVPRKVGSLDKESTCDGMLTFTDSLFLVELKNERKNWFMDGLGQIENTKRLMRKQGAIDQKYLKAYVCNKKHPHFTTIDNSFSRKFKNETGFRIDNQATIKIK